MRPRICIRQERPRSTTAGFQIRVWNLFVCNPCTGAYEYYGFAWSLFEAITVAHIIYNRNALGRGGIVQEVTA